MSHLKYRADIDGLRAVAVSSVIIYHAFPTALRGGFTGVDIFFVISGYLISGILLKSHTDKTFSFADFYYRRARRILPSLYVVLLATLIASPLILFGPEIRQLAQTTISALLFSANVTLFRQASYFDTASDLKPLLHLWSLGVEEQFYFLWPLLLVALFKFRRALFSTAIALLFISLALNLYFVTDHPSATFFLPHTRFWELLCGCLLAIWQTNRTQPIAKNLATAISLAGLALVIAGLYISDSSSPYPGWRALFPVLGATALIAAGQEALINRTLLSLRAFVWIGLISYPLYLWHWPLLVYLRFANFAQPTALARALAVIASIALANLTYRYLEIPVRQKKLFVSMTRDLLKFTAAVAALALALNAASKTLNPYPASMTLGQKMGSQVVTSCLVDKADRSLFTFCQTDTRAPVTSAVWGDSKAGAIFPGLVTTAPPGEGWTVIGRPSCAPTIGIKRTSFSWDNGDDCHKADTLALQQLLTHKEITTIVVVSAYRIMFHETYETLDHVKTSAIPGFISALKTLVQNKKNVIVLLDNPTLRDPTVCAARPIDFGTARAQHCAISLQDHLAATKQNAELTAAINKDVPDVKIFDPTSALCRNGQCPMVAADGNFLYSYGDHLSDTGSTLVARALRKTLF